jgi:hypothetical protein
MTTLREAAQQALEALKSCSGVPHWPALQPTITALRKALAQREQEDIAQNLKSRLDAALLLEERRQEITQPRREWQSLSEEEIRAYGKDLKYRDGDYERFARAIEAKIKEKNA